METRTILLCFIALIFGFCSAIPLREGSLVYPRLLEERGSRGGPVLKINEDITLNLKKSSVLGDEFLLRSYVGDVAKHTYMDGSYLEECLFRDDEAMASVMVFNDGEFQVEGMIGNSLGIMPAPEQERSSDGHPAHVLYEIQDSPSELYHDIVHQSVGNLNVTDRALSQDEINKAQIIHPELFLMVDTTFFSQFKNNEHKLIKYLCLSVNAMNLRYLSVSDPEVEFKLVGVEILTKEKEERLLQKFKNDSDAVDAYMTVFGMPYFVNRIYGTFYKPFDLIYLITGLDLASADVKGINRGNKGIAHIAAVCGYSRVGLGEDRAYSFTGVHIMTHEIGHVMGCPHDGQRGTIVLGGQGSKECSFEDGYIMSYRVKNLNYYKFSSCCNRLISLMSRSPYGRCLHVQNTVPTLKENSAQLPGYRLPLTKQCRRAFPGVPRTYYMKEEPIVDCEMWCSMPKGYSNETKLKIKLADGSKCDDSDNVCINGVCRPRQKSYREDDC